MRKTVATLAVLAWVIAVAHAQDKRGTPVDDKLLIANEHALWDAVAKADKASFQALAAADGVWTTKSGFVPVKLLADRLNDFQVAKWDVVNPRVVWLDENSVLLTYVWTGSGLFGGQALTPATLASTVWVKRSGKWLTVHHQETDLHR